MEFIAIDGMEVPLLPLSCIFDPHFEFVQIPKEKRLSKYIDKNSVLMKRGFSAHGKIYVFVTQSIVMNFLHVYTDGF